MKLVSEEIEGWWRSDGEKTVGGLMDVFDEKAFALLFVLLMAVPALPMPTGGATHVFEVIVVLLALQLVVGRRELWLPERFRARALDGPRQEKFINGLLRFIRRMERFSKPRLRFLFGSRVSNAVYGLIVIGLTVVAFFAPPFSGLDTLPSLGVVILSLGVLLEDAILAVFGVVVGVAGALIAWIIGEAAFNFIKDLF
jgi:hypothetical protein